MATPTPDVYSGQAGVPLIAGLQPVSHALAGAASGRATAAGGLTHGIPLSGVAASVATAAGTLLAGAVEQSLAASTAPTLAPVTTHGTGARAWTAGMSFAYGEVPTGATLGAPNASLQVDVRNRYDDGSLRFAVLSGVTTAQEIIILRGGTPASGTNVAEPNVQASVAFSSVVDGSGNAVAGGSFTADLSTARSNGSMAWTRTTAHKMRQILGPVMSEFHYFVPTADTHTHVWFYVRAYANGQVSVRVMVQNSWLLVASPGQRTYNANVSIAGASVFSGGITQYHHTRWSHLYWAGTPGHVMMQSVKHLQGTTMVPRVALDSVDATVWSAHPDAAPKYSAWTQDMAERPTPFSIANIDPALGAGGATDGVGPLPAWDMVFVATGDPRAYWSVLGNTSAMGRFVVHYYDEATGRPFEGSRHVDLRASGGGVSDAQGGFPATPSPSGGYGSPAWFYSHGPKCGYLAYLLTGEWFHLETVQHFSGYGPLWQAGYSSIMYGGNHTPIPWWNQLRSNANLFDWLMKAALITPQSLAGVDVSGGELSHRTEVYGRLDVSIRLWNDIYSPAGAFSNVGPYDGVPESLRNNVFGAFFQQLSNPVPEATVSQMQQGYIHNALMWGFLARVPTTRQADLQWLASFCTRYQIGLLGATASNPRPEWRMPMGYEHCIGTSDPYSTPWVLFPTWRAAWDYVASKPYAPQNTQTLPLPAGNMMVGDASELSSDNGWVVGFDIKGFGEIGTYNSHAHAFSWSVAFMHGVGKRLGIAEADIAADRFYGSDSFAMSIAPGGSWASRPNCAVMSLDWTPTYVPRTVGEAKYAPSTNSLNSVRQTGMPPGSMFGPESLGDFSGGVFDAVTTRWGRQYVHGGGHAVGHDSGLYRINFGNTSVTWERSIDVPNLQALGKWSSYPGTNETAYDYFIQHGPNSTGWSAANKDNPAMWELPDTPEGNPREVIPNWPGSCHTYGNVHYLPPEVAGKAQGGFLRSGSFAVGSVVSRETYWFHLGTPHNNSWERFLPTSMPTDLRTLLWVVDTRRWRLKAVGLRGHVDLITRAPVEIQGSVTGIVSNYWDFRVTAFHEYADIFVFGGNTTEEVDVGTPIKMNWWPAASDNGVRNVVSWTNASPPPVSGINGPSGAEAAAQLLYIPELRKLFYYTRADRDAYFLITVPSNPANPWTWERKVITGAAKPSLMTNPSPHPHIYGRMQWAPSLRSIVYVPLAKETGYTLDRVALIRLMP